MKNRREVSQLFAAVAALTAVSSAQAQFGGLLGGGKGGGGSSSADIDAVVALTVELGKATGILMNQLLYAYANKAEAAKYLDIAKSIQAQTKPSEIGASLSDTSKSADVIKANLADTAEAEAAFNKLSPEMQKFVWKSVGTGVSAIAKGVLAFNKFKDLMAKPPSNPMELVKLKDCATPLEFVFKNVPPIFSQVGKLASRVKQDVPKPDEGAKLVASAEGWPENTNG
jgi:hypothetical protein